MSTITAETFRKDFLRQIETVFNLGQEITITHKGKSAVLISKKEFSSLMETAHLLASENNRAHLKKSLLQAKKKQVVKVDLSDL
jgi:antitoxin YefM